MPLTSVAELDAESSSRGNVWFELADDRPAFFAGNWAPWTSVRQLKDGETIDDLCAFLMTEPNKEEAKVHPKAMPVIFTEPDELDGWMKALWKEALELKRPLADGSLETR